MDCIRDCRTILVTGITGSGKTTLLRALAGLLPAGETRLVLDGRDLGLQGPQYEHAAVRAANPYGPPRVLVVDNVRPSEAGLILRALGSGCHAGSLVGLGAESVEEALNCLAAWGLTDGLCWEEARFGVAAGIELGVGLARDARGPRVAEAAFVEAAAAGWTLRPA